VRHLLDANALIALVISDHEHHSRAAQWIAGRPFALCPISEGALVRFLVRIGEGQDTAVALLAALGESPQCEFWPDSLSCADADLGHVIGHRQVTDAYLASLAVAHSGRLATLDRALATTLPDRVDLIP